MGIFYLLGQAAFFLVAGVLLVRGVLFVIKKHEERYKEDEEE